MILLGLLLGLVGTDVNSGRARASPSASPELSDGIGFVPVAMGMFGFAEIIAQSRAGREQREVVIAKVGSLLPTRADIKRDPWRRSLRGTVLGSLLGILPGGGALLGVLRRLHAREEVSRRTRRASARAPSRASRRRNRPTMPARRPRSSRC